MQIKVLKSESVMGFQKSVLRLIRNQSTDYKRFIKDPPEVLRWEHRVDLFSG